MTEILAKRNQTARREIAPDNEMVGGRKTNFLTRVHTCARESGRHMLMWLLELALDCSRRRGENKEEKRRVGKKERRSRFF